MLVLKRAVGQTLRIGDRVLVRVLEIDQGRVKLGIEAPQDVEIWRDEVPFDDEGAPAA